MATAADARAAGFATPIGSDLVTNGDDAITKNAIAAVDKFTEQADFNATVKTRYRGLLGETDLNTVGQGRWWQQWAANATTARNYPVAAAGWLIAVNTEPNNQITQTYETSSAGTWRRHRDDAYKWGPWQRVDSTIRRRSLLGTADLDTITDEGYARQRWASNATADQHYPVTAAGWLLTIQADDSSAVVQFYYADTAAAGVWQRTFSGGVWGAWGRIGADPTAALAPGAPGMSATRRAARVSAARKRHLGGVGTAGGAAVALRFDDGHADFKTKVLPVLQKYGLASYIAVTDRLLVESGVTYAELQAWAINSGAEVTAHSRDHVNQTSDPAILSAVHTFGDDLEKAVGGVVVDTWTFPGGGDFGGLDAGASASLFAETYAGRLVLERYAVPNGGAAGYLQPLTGEPTIGQVHVTIETYSLAQVQEKVREAQDRGAGITFMMHPTRLDTSGYMSSAVLDQVCAWIAGEQEAGRLTVLSGTGMGLAHTGADTMNLLRGGDMLTPSAWTGTSWTFTDGAASTGTYLAELKQSVTINAFAGSRGAPAALDVWVTGSAGADVRLAVSGSSSSLNASRRVVLDGSTTPRRLTLPITIPAGTALGSTLDVTIQQRVGTVTVHRAVLRTN